MQEGGLRLQGKSIPTHQDTPLISVVTVCYNAEKTIRQTIESVLQQQDVNIEYIIIDGNSKDNTVNIIEEYEHKITYWRSEPDKGIYDAMNKGVIVSTGHFINFMNAGDRFYNSKVIKAVLDQNLENVHLAYGDCVVVYPNGNVRPVKAKPLGDLWKGMVFSHQSLFASRATLVAFPFTTEFGTAEDFNFIFNAYHHGLNFKYLGFPICIVSAGGVSDTQRLQSLNMAKKIVSSHESYTKLAIYYGFRQLSESAKAPIKKILQYRFKSSKRT